MSGADWRRACCCGGGCDCGCDGPLAASSDGGKSPFSWGDTCTWMVNATYSGGGAAADNGDGTCTWTYTLETSDGNANPMGVYVDITCNADGTYDVEATDAMNNVIYSASGLSGTTFACVDGELSGTATLSADYCAGDPDVTFTL